MDILLQQIINGLTTGSVYAVVALGYTMVYGVIQLINFAHGEVVMIGAMVAFSIITSLAGSGLPPLAIVLAGRHRGDSGLHGHGLPARTRRPIVPCATRRAWRR
jgi:branched-subunit amino acid ABC-type transport system permease component